MNQRQKSALLFAAYILFVIAVLLWLAKEVAYGGPPPFPGSHKKDKIPPPSQGSGAELLMSKTWPSAVNIPPSPPLFHTPIAWDYPSNQWSSVTNFRIHSGPLPGEYTTNTLAGKTLTNMYPWVRKSVNYVCVSALGTNGTESICSNEIRVPPVYTNYSKFVVTVSTSNATNLQYSSLSGKSWSLLGSTNYPETNPAPRLWRAMGRSMPTLSITGKWQ